MSVRIRLSRHGKKKAPFYRLVVADSHSPRDGRFIEILGTYNPLVDPAEIKIKRRTRGVLARQRRFSVRYGEGAA